MSRKRSKRKRSKEAQERRRKRKQQQGSIKKGELDLVQMSGESTRLSHASPVSHDFRSPSSFGFTFLSCLQLCRAPPFNSENHIGVMNLEATATWGGWRLRREENANPERNGPSLPASKRFALMKMIHVFLLLFVCVTSMAMSR